MTTPHLDTLQRDGYVVMPDVLDAVVLPAIKTAAKHILDTHGSDTMGPVRNSVCEAYDVDFDKGLKQRRQKPPLVLGSGELVP